jgi:hypothetical protein
MDGILRHHVHRRDLRWILPVAGVKGEVDRANNATREWYSNPAGLACSLDSKDFLFSKFIPECYKENSMRNRKRTWKIYKQYRALWETVGFEV